MGYGKLKRPVLAALGLVFLLAAPVAAKENPADPWIDDLAAALANAQASERPVLVYVLDSI
jgi:hypothetical protein